MFNCGFYVSNLMNLVISFSKPESAAYQNLRSNVTVKWFDLSETVGVSSIKYTIVITATTLRKNINQMRIILMGKVLTSKNPKDESHNASICTNSKLKIC